MNLSNIYVRIAMWEKIFEKPLFSESSLIKKNKNLFKILFLEKKQMLQSHYQYLKWWDIPEIFNSLIIMIGEI
jgi:hypothetical protein